MCVTSLCGSGGVVYDRQRRSPPFFLCELQAGCVQAMAEDPDGAGPSCALPDPSFSVPDASTALQGVQATMYVKPTCPHCHRAEQILSQYQAQVTVVDVSENPQLREEIATSVGGFPTVPMIFLRKKFVGGCDDLLALTADAKKLQGFLASALAAD